MVKTLTDLSLEYFDAVKKMDCLIKKCTHDIKEAKKCGDYKKSIQLKRKRLVFYSQKRDLMETAYKLQNYYRKEECK